MSTPPMVPTLDGVDIAQPVTPSSIMTARARLMNCFFMGDYSFMILSFPCAQQRKGAG